MAPLCTLDPLRYKRPNGTIEPEDEQMTRPLRTLSVTLAFCGLAGCTPPDVTRAPSAPSSDPIAGPIGPLANPVAVDANTGTCYTRAITPALIETVTEQVMVAAVTNDAGTVIAPATFRTQTRQEILRERREVEFETPCAHITTPAFIASVQRALFARGYYNGPINGQLDTRTSTAVERFQIAENDVHTKTLTLETARSLGLVAVPRDPL